MERNEKGVGQVLGTTHLASDGYEVQRTNNFELTVAGLAEITGNMSDVDTLTLSVDSTSLPSEQSEVQQLNYSNRVSKVAGTTTYGSGSLVVKDVISEHEDVEAIIVAWRNAVFNPNTDQVGLAYNYKKDGRLKQYAPDGSLERTWILQGLWPSAVSYGDMQYGSGGAIKTISITLEYDTAVREGFDYGTL